MPHNKVGDVEKSPSINFRTNAVSEVARFSANLRNAFEVSTGGQGTKTDLGANSTNPPSTDQSLSAHSEGTGSSKPSRRVWSLSRFWRFLRRGRMPIVMILVIVISSLTALTGFLSWGLTNISATNSVSDMSKALQVEIIRAVYDLIVMKLDTVEAATQAGDRFFTDGLYSSATLQKKIDTTQSMFDAIYAYKALYTAQWFTTVPEGERWGVIVDEENGTNKFSKWMHDASNGYEVLVDREGHNVSVTTTYPGANYSTAASAWWLEELNMTNPSSYNWNPVEYSDNRAWKTHSRVVADPTNNVIGAFSTSISLDFLSFQLDEIADHVPYPTLNYVFESVGNVSRIIATSDSDTDIYFRDAFSNIIGTETFESFAQRDEHVKPIYEWFLANRHGQLHEAEDVHDEEDEDAHHAEETHTEEGDEDSHGHSNSQLHSHHEMPSITLKLPTGQFQMMFTKITRDNLDWTLLTLVNRDKVMQPFDTSTRRTLGIVLAIVFTSFLFSLLFAWMLSKALHRITRDLSLLANFKFQDVLQQDISKETGLQRPSYSRIAELWLIQRAFHKMVITFAEAVYQNKKMSERKPGSNVHARGFATSMSNLNMAANESLPPILAGHPTNTANNASSNAVLLSP